MEEKPLSPLGQSLALLGVGAVMLLYVEVQRNGGDLGASSIAARYIACGAIGIAVLRLAYLLLTKLPSVGRPASLDVPHDDVVKAPRPEGAPARVACRKCGELVASSTLENGKCDACWAVREGQYR